MGPPTTITTPPRDFGPNGAPTTYFTDPDVLTVEPEFDARSFSAVANSTESNEVVRWASSDRGPGSACENGSGENAASNDDCAGSAASIGPAGVARD